MTLTNALVAFFNDAKFETVAILIVVDIILGVAAAVKLGTFRLSYISDFLRNDVLEKVLPWSAVYIGAKLGHTVAVVDLGKIADGLWLFVLAALLGSLASSLADLGTPVPTVARTFRGFIAGGENAGPPKD